MKNMTKVFSGLRFGQIIWKASISAVGKVFSELMDDDVELK